MIPVYLVLILSDSPDEAQLTRTRDHAQCEYVGQNLMFDLRIAGKSGEVYCVSIPERFKTGTILPTQDVLKYQGKKLQFSPD